MKKLLVAALVAVVIAGFIFTSNSQALVVRNHVGDGQIDEKQLIAAIEIPLSELATGIADRDAALIFGIFSDPQKARYVRDGAIYESIESAEQTYARRFAKQDQSVARLFEFRVKEYDIISAETVLFTGIGVLESTGSEDDDDPWEIAYTILWALESDEWKAINMHISWE